MRCYGDKPAWFQRETGGLLPVVRLDGDLITDSVSIMFALERAFADDTESLLPQDWTRIGYTRLQPLFPLDPAAKFEAARL